MTTFHSPKAVVPSTALLKFLRAQKCGQFQYSHVSNQCKLLCDTTAPIYSSHLPRGHRSIATCAWPPASLESSFILSKSTWLQEVSHKHDSRCLRVESPPATHCRWSTVRSTSRSGAVTVHRRNSSGLWGFGKEKPKDPLRPNDLSPLSEVLDDNPSWGRPLRPAHDLKLRCTEFDENGNVVLVNGEFKKTELIAKYGLLPRDLRKIDSSLLPSISVRPTSILINLLHLRVLIKHNRVLVFDAYGSTDSYTQSLFMYDLEGKLRAHVTEAQYRGPHSTTPDGTPNGTTGAGVGASGSVASNGSATLPYEFRALEAVLISVTNGLESEFEVVREPVVRVLRELEEDIDRDKLRHLLIYSKKLGTFEQKARLVRDAIDDLLEADDDLAATYLSEKARGILRDEGDHTEVEMLLESYHKVCDEIVQGAGSLVSGIRNTEEVVKAILDSNRNSLMLLDLKFSIATLGIGGGTFVAALYGMNLKNFIEETDYGFVSISAWCTLMGVAVCWWGFRKLRRVQRLSMWGAEGGESTRGKSGWANLGERPVDMLGFGLARREKEKVKAMKEASNQIFKVGNGGAWAGHGFKGVGEASPPVALVLKKE